jgi:MFS family permease
VPPERRHSDVLIAGLILIGTLVIAVVAGRLLSLPGYGMMAFALIAALAASYVARRVLADLALDEVAIAAAIIIALVFGISYHINGRPLRFDIVLPIAAAVGGALLGAVATRYREPPHGIYLTLAIGAAGLGAGFLAEGLLLMLGASRGGAAGAMLGAAFLGCVVSAYFTNARAGHGALGMGLLFGVLVLITSGTAVATFGAIFVGMVLGIIGAAIGAALRKRRRPELPSARTER